MIPLVGFLPADDPRVAGTVDAVQRELVADGFVQRYRSDGGRRRPARRRGRVPPLLVLAGRLPRTCSAAPTRPGRCSSGCSGCANDVGLLAEEYDPAAGRLLGNFPQAFTHVSLVNTAGNLSGTSRPAAHRATGDGPGVR